MVIFVQLRKRHLTLRDDQAAISVLPINQGRRNDFQRKRGQIVEVENGAIAPAVALARRRGCLNGERGCVTLRIWSFFENVVLNKVICTIFHHVKNLTSFLTGCFSLVMV